ncbi:MAG: alpha/beta hydrolase-fold protein [Chloroflexota bacterium]|nr:alpha/beta hydrolase-fold protein [Chloroflexota bacterium]
MKRPDRLIALETAVAAGDGSALNAFWSDAAARGGPLVERADGPNAWDITFFWRGDADTHRVLLFGGFAGLRLIDMAQIPGTDVWYAGHRAASGLRTSYEFRPNVELEGDINSDPALVVQAVQSEGWSPDPLNPDRIDFGVPQAPTMSIVAVPDAPPQPWLRSRAGVPAGTVEPHRFDSVMLGNARVIWTYTPPGYRTDGEPYPLVVLFDGFDYSKIGIASTLDNLIAEQRIPPVICVMIHQLDRISELPCNAQFIDCIADELLPRWVRERYHATGDRVRTVAGGLSFGGLAAAWAGFRRPDVVGNVLSQSGSFWWGPGAPVPARLDDTSIEWEWLVHQYEASPRLPLRFYLDVGTRELPFHKGIQPNMVACNRVMRDVLEAKGYDVQYAEFVGGHDYACWRGTVADGLIALLGPFA